MREHETKHITKTKLKCVAKEHKSLEPCALKVAYPRYIPPICITIRAQEDLIACAQNEHIGLRSPMALTALEKQNKGV